MEEQQFTLLCFFFLLLDLHYYGMLESAHSKFPKDIYLVACL